MRRAALATTESVECLAPPYRARLPPGERPAELGTIVLIDTRPGSVALDELLRMQDSAPWCAVCLLHDSTPEAQTILKVARRLLPSVVGIQNDEAPITADEAKSAVTRRGAPGLLEIATYVSGRLRVPILRDLLMDCLGTVGQAGAGRGKSRRTLDRHLRVLGTLSASDWRALAQTARALTWFPHPTSIEQLAWAFELDPRTFRGRCRTFLGLSPRHALELVGWEWMLEAAIRRFGFLGSTDVSRSPSRANDRSAACLA